MRLWNTK